MKTHPSCEFFIFDSGVYYNSIPSTSGTINRGADVPITAGYVSLYELNVDRLSSSTGRFIGPLGKPEEPSVAVVDNGLIYPYITKDGTTLTWRSVATASNYATDFEFGDVMSSSYPMSASITREYMAPLAGKLITGDPTLLPAGADPVSDSTPVEVFNRPKYPHYWALKTTLDYYGYISEHYKVTASVNNSIVYKDQQTINLLSIPSIFYGSKIKPGTVSLKWYYTGSLAGELKDTRQNGELIQVWSSDSAAYNDKVGGVVLYDEGFVLLTGSWALNDETLPIVKGDGTAYAPSWKFFGAGANDGVSQATTGQNFYNASFVLSFKGTTEVQTTTMFANARRGEVNFSNNPTYLNYVSESAAIDETPQQADPNYWIITSSYLFEEKERTITNFGSSSAQHYSASFKRQVYISKIGVYDDNKNLIGIASLSSPVLKEEAQDLTFKIKLDI
tara:strand:+ start:17618 stop:18961 length:1344 start_codon:yes stop_codon:yes gene_type:complete